MNTFWRCALLLIAVLIWPTAHAAEHTRAMVLASCRFADLSRAARCGTLSVPENPDRPDGRRLSIGVVVIPATNAPALADPIVVLQGGPGEDTIGSAAFYAGRFAPLSRGRVAEWIRLRLYRSSSAAPLPWTMHRAYAGDWNPLVKDLLADAHDADSALSFGLFLSITCSEDVAFVRERDVGPETQGSATPALQAQLNQAPVGTIRGGSRCQ